VRAATAAAAAARAAGKIRISAIASVHRWRQQLLRCCFAAMRLLSSSSAPTRASAATHNALCWMLRRP
jgi:hypothetical protein